MNKFRITITGREDEYGYSGGDWERIRSNLLDMMLEFNALNIKILIEEESEDR